MVNIILQITPGIFLYHISGFNDKNYDNINLVKNNYIISNYSITKNKKYFSLEFKISNKQKKIFRKFFFTKNLDLINIYYFRQRSLRIFIKTNRTIGPFYEALSYRYSYIYYEYSYITKILI